jgi:hypothetical protein
MCIFTFIEWSETMSGSESDKSSMGLLETCILLSVV